MRINNNKGFTLLEAVIAIMIFSLGTSAIYSWINSNLITLGRVDHINTRSSLTESALEFIGTINVDAMPNGSELLGDARVEWSTTPTKYSGMVLNEENGETISQARLVDTNVSVFLNGEIVSEFKLSLLAVKQVKELSEIFID